MILILTPSASEKEISALLAKAEGLDIKAQRSKDGDRTVIILDSAPLSSTLDEFSSSPSVEKIIQMTNGNGLYSSEEAYGKSIIENGDFRLGGGNIQLFAGPCSIENYDQTLEVANSIKASGAKVIRGGAFKPRTSPYSFQGLGLEALEILSTVRKETGLLVATEALSVDSLQDVYEHSDFIQIGSRNMQNTHLLKESGKLDKPVILKRGMAATLKEWLLAAEYILTEGNDQVILCERGVRTFLDHSRFTLDLGVIPALKEKTNLPVIVDPSHGTGKRSHVSPMALAALAAGADGLMVEVHPDPDKSISDAEQSIDFITFSNLCSDVKKVANSLNLTF